MDEVDAMEAGIEGSPITLAVRHTLSFANRKTILGSDEILSPLLPTLFSGRQPKELTLALPVISFKDRRTNRSRSSSPGANAESCYLMEKFHAASDNPQWDSTS